MRAHVESMKPSPETAVKKEPVGVLTKEQFLETRINLQSKIDEEKEREEKRAQEVPSAIGVALGSETFKQRLLHLERQTLASKVDVAKLDQPTRRQNVEALTRMMKMTMESSKALSAARDEMWRRWALFQEKLADWKSDDRYEHYLIDLESRVAKQIKVSWDALSRRLNREQNPFALQLGRPLHSFSRIRCRQQMVRRACRLKLLRKPLWDRPYHQAVEKALENMGRVKFDRTDWKVIKSYKVEWRPMGHRVHVKSFSAADIERDKKRLKTFRPSRMSRRQEKTWTKILSFYAEENKRCL